MAAQPFNRDKMRWLNAVCKDCNVSATAFRIAYLLGDHFNSVTGVAWPSHKRLASIICAATKTVQRGLRELENRGWITIQRSRSRRTTNRYRLHWPVGEERADKDKSVPNNGHSKANKEDEDVSQSYLSNLPRTSLSGSRGKKSHFPDRGLYEQKIIERFGPRAEEALVELNKTAPHLLDAICRAEKDGELTAADMHGLQLHLASLRNPETSQLKG